MGLETVLDRIPEELRQKYIHDLPNINLLRTKAQVQAKDNAKDGRRTGHFFTREMRPIEVDIVNHLCPQTMSFGQKEKLKAWKWVLTQPWGEELAGLHFAKRFF